MMTMGEKMQEGKTLQDNLLTMENAVQKRGEMEAMVQGFLD